MNTLLPMTNEQYNKFRVSSYMGLLYQNKCAILGIHESENTKVLEVGEGIDIDVLHDVYFPFVESYEENAICE
tara:strand:+ start:1007 stop:1225 length:219 start_codon:yes stop_codon:yes gene_type:complete